jgi:proton glutamate symport protein
MKFSRPFGLAILLILVALVLTVLAANGLVALPPALPSAARWLALVELRLHRAARSPAG